MLSRTHWLPFFALLFIIATPIALHAGSGDRVQIGKSIVVEENEEAGNLVCIGCSVRMAGNCGDIVVVGGSISVDGTVNGDTVVVGGGMHLSENASVAGDVVTVGGGLSRHPNANVKGEITTESGAFIVLMLVLVPLIPVILIVALVVWLVGRNRQPAPIRA